MNFYKVQKKITRKNTKIIKVLLLFQLKDNIKQITKTFSKRKEIIQSNKNYIRNRPNNHINRGPLVNILTTSIKNL